MSEVLLATSLTICAPMFSSASRSSISFATVTPSLVMVGEPNARPRMTLRPRGPSVTLTALARLLTPRRIPCREASPYTICFAIGSFALSGGLDDGRHCVLSHDASEHPDDPLDDPQQESQAQRDRYANSQDHEWDAEDDSHR